MSDHYNNGTRQHDEAYAGLVYLCGCGQNFASASDRDAHILEELLHTFERIELDFHDSRANTR